MPRFVYVYSGEGASQRSILSTIESLKATLHGVQVRQLNALDLLAGGWQPYCALLLIPGGADLPYCQHLNGHGNKLIKEFVINGGAYMGICAGAYFACQRIEFEMNTPLEVEGERELAFFPGVGRGAVQRGFDYATESGTAAVPIRFQDPRQEGEWQNCCDYSNGGPAFILESDTSNSVEVLAEYRREDIEGSAAVKCQVGSGVAVLSGTHPELGFRWLDAHCHGEYIQRSNPRMTEQAVIKLVLHTTKLRAALSEEQENREDLWKTLLVAAGLKDNIRWTKTPIELERLKAKKQRIQLDALLTPTTLTLSK